MNSGYSRRLLNPWLLALAIMAAGAIAALNFTTLRQRVHALQFNLSAQTAAREKAETALQKTAADLAKALTELKQATAERDEAMAQADEATQRANRLTKDFAAVREQRDNAQAEMFRYRVIGLKPEEVMNLANELKQLRTGLQDAKQEIAALSSKLQKTIAPTPNQQDVVVLPADLKARVIGSDPKWHFIVLDTGRDHGVLERGEVLVTRASQLVARAKVSRVQSDRCVADILPGWELAQVLEGDAAIAAPAK